MVTVTIALKPVTLKRIQSSFKGDFYVVLNLFNEIHIKPLSKGPLCITVFLRQILMLMSK